jgi:hypothetical protein
MLLWLIPLRGILVSIGRVSHFAKTCGRLPFASFPADGWPNCKPAIAGRIEFNALLRRCLRALSAVFRDCRLVTSSRPRVRRPAHAGQTLRSDSVRRVSESAVVDRAGRCSRASLVAESACVVAAVFRVSFGALARLLRWLMAWLRSHALAVGPRRRRSGTLASPFFRASFGPDARCRRPTPRPPGRPPIARPYDLSTVPQFFTSKNVRAPQLVNLGELWHPWVSFLPRLSSGRLGGDGNGSHFLMSRGLGRG